jgi:hypothetical protein
VSRPWRLLFPRSLWWAVVFRALLGCWSRQVALSPFLGCVCVLPFPSFFIIPRFYGFVPCFFGILCLFLVLMAGLLLVRRAGDKPLPLLTRVRLPWCWLKHNHSNGYNQAKLRLRSYVCNRLCH